MNLNQNMLMAKQLLQNFKGNAYYSGTQPYADTVSAAARLGKTAFLVHSANHNLLPFVQELKDLLSDAGVDLCGQFSGIRPNAPMEDLLHLTDALRQCQPEFVISLGGGSVIDTAKAAMILLTLGGEMESYFGNGLVTQALARQNKTLLPHVAIQTAASSAAHLTKYSNITNPQTHQKKLIVDDAIIPTLSAFDYRTTLSAPPELTIDGALDGISHGLEVFYGAVGKPHYEQVKTIALTAIALILEALPQALTHPHDLEARTALGLATDLGGVAIMIGSTNGGHLTSFSLVDLLPHGRACAMLNPYYSVYFAPAIQEPLRLVGSLYQHAGFTQADFFTLAGRSLGIAVAEAMFNFHRSLGVPTALKDVPGFSPAYIEQALQAAKNPQLEMKLAAMPLPMSATTIDSSMAPILAAAVSGDINLIQTIDG